MSTTESTTIEEAAAQLAAAIKESADWKNFQETNEKFEKNEEISGMLEEYRRLFAEIQGAHANGSETAEGMRQLDQLRIRIQQAPLFEQRERAADGMLSVLGQANAALTVNLGLDFAANAQPRKNCCGEGGKEGGCDC